MAGTTNFDYFKEHDPIFHQLAAAAGKPMATSQDFVNWVPTEVIDPDWLKWFFVAEKESLFRFGKGYTHTTVYFPEWLSMHIELSHIEEQTEIVRRVEQLFAYANQIEQRVKDAQARVNHLTQSILAKAFAVN